MLLAFLFLLDLLAWAWWLLWLLLAVGAVFVPMWSIIVLAESAMGRRHR